MLERLIVGLATQDERLDERDLRLEALEEYYSEHSTSVPN